MPSDEEFTEDQINEMTLKTKLFELREAEKQREEEEQRKELRRLVLSGRSANNRETIVGSSTRVMADHRIKKPPNLEECSSYDMFRKKLELWEVNTNLSDAQKGNFIIQTLTNTSKFKKNLSKKFLSKHTVEEMSGEGSLKKVKDFLDTELKEKDLEKAVRKWRDLRS